MVDRTHEVIGCSSLGSLIGESTYRKPKPLREGYKIGGGRYLVSKTKYASSAKIYDLEKDRYVIGRPSSVDGVFGEGDTYYFSLIIDGERVSKTFSEWYNIARGKVLSVNDYDNSPKIKSYTCEICEVSFKAKSSAKYCIDCRKEVIKTRERNRVRAKRE